MDPEEVARLYEKLSLAEEGVLEVRINPKLHELGMRNVSISLVGKIISNKDMNREAFKAKIAKIWRTTKEVGVESIAVKTYIFRFKCAWDMKIVLQGGPWCFEKQLICLQEADGMVKEIDTGENKQCLGSFIRSG
ncbi:hypothetical protein ACOSQ2_013492 [Xanthoceras sorbifolium]